VRRSRWPVYAVVALAAVLLFGRWVASLYVDYLWYRELGATALWRAQTGNTLLLRGLSALAGTMFLFINLYAVRQSVVSVILPRRVANLEIGEEVPSRFLLAAVAALSLLIGALLTIPQESWTTLGLARYGVPFGESDPYFNSDLGQFVYWLPLERSVYTWSLLALLVAVGVVVLLYGVTSSLRWERGTLYASTYARRHLTALAFVLLLILAWSYRLDAFAVLFHGSGPDGAFSSVDHSVTIPVNLALQLAAIGAALVVLWAGWTGQVRVAFITVSAILALSLALQHVFPLLAGRLAPDTDPAVRERRYLGVRAGYTRRAYDVDRVGAAGERAEFATQREAARGTPVWDDPALARAADRLARSGEGRPRVGWVGEPWGAVGEVVEPRARAAGDSWILLRVSGIDTDARGEPLLVDAQGASTEDAGVLPPAIVSDSAGAYAIVADSSGRLPAASLEPWGSRLAHAWSLQNFRILFGTLPYPTPRIVLRRSVRERVYALAPFFAQGSAVSPVVAEDSLYWVLHLYSASASYPLSRPTTVAGADLSYLRHAAVAVVSAHSGRVSLVADSLLDPVATTWVSTFPTLFSSWSTLPPTLPAALPPASDGALVQAEALGAYGTRVVALSGLRPALADGADSVLGAPAPAHFVLSGAADVPAVAFPLVDDADRVNGIIVATGGAQPATWWRPIDGPRPRWGTVVDRLRRAPEAPTGEPGSRIVRGAVRVIPTAAGVLFAQTHYFWRGDGTPAVARAVVETGDSIRVGRTLADALGERTAPVVPATDRPATFRQGVAAAYEAMRAALRRGDWRAFGEAYDALGRLLAAPPR